MWITAHLLVRTTWYTTDMKKVTIAQQIIRLRLIKDRNNLIKTLKKNGYNYTQLGVIFNLNHSSVLRILEEKKQKTKCQGCEKQFKPLSVSFGDQGDSEYYCINCIIK